MTILSILRIIGGSIYVLFLPGFILTYVFFQKKDKEIDWLERITLSLALSIAVVPIVVFLMSFIGLKVTALNVAIEILWIILLSVGWLFFKKSVYYQKMFEKISKFNSRKKWKS